jgi:pyridine nucleotide-disulfide oxidoreductase family protein
MRLALIGGGHAHMEIVRRLITTGHPLIDLILVSQSDRHHYSGMVPGYLRGTYNEEQVSFYLPAFAEAAGAEFVQARAVGVDPKKRVVRLEDGNEIGYDIASFNLGSRLLGDDETSVAKNAALVKPMSRAVELYQKIRQLAENEESKTRRVVVVGGGSAGVEVACSIAAVLDDSGCSRDVTVLDGSNKILAGYSQRFRARAGRVLQKKNIAVRLGQRVTGVHEDSVELTGGSRMGSDLTVWLTGPAAHPVFQDSGLALDKRNFLLINDSLQSISDPKIFGVGDCATLANYPDTPKAGVYAVRQAPILWESLLAAVEDRPLPTYEPQHGFLSLLNTSDGKALMRYKGYVGWNRWAWHLKDWIDRSFMTQYQNLVK